MDVIIIFVMVVVGGCFSYIGFTMLFEPDNIPHRAFGFFILLVGVLLVYSAYKLSSIFAARALSEYGTGIG